MGDLGWLLFDRLSLSPSLWDLQSTPDRQGWLDLTSCRHQRSPRFVMSPAPAFVTAIPPEPLRDLEDVLSNERKKKKEEEENDRR